MQEMASAWQWSVDMQLGIFADVAPETSPFIFREGLERSPVHVKVLPHQLWTKVRVSSIPMRNSTKHCFLFSLVSGGATGDGQVLEHQPGGRLR